MHPQTPPRRFRLQKVEKSADFQPTRSRVIRSPDTSADERQDWRNFAKFGGFRHSAFGLMPEIASREIDQLSNCYLNSGRMRIFNY